MFHYLLIHGSLHSMIGTRYPPFYSAIPIQEIGWSPASCSPVFGFSSLLFLILLSLSSKLLSVVCSPFCFLNIHNYMGVLVTVIGWYNGALISAQPQQPIQYSWGSAHYTIKTKCQVPSADSYHSSQWLNTNTPRMCPKKAQLLST